MYTIAKRFAFSASHVIGGLHTFAQKVLSRTRQGFGGHNEAKSHGCPSRKLYPCVAMMQSGQDWRSDDRTRSLDGSS
jgi:hypothetical protein